jgi:hypothetical protein
MIRPLVSQFRTQTHTILCRTLRNPIMGAQRSAAACVRFVDKSASSTAYLRAAQAYMLISMPTGTSTIFGVFQAILALLQQRDELHPCHKLARNENFASEIFAANPGGSCCGANSA